MSRKHSAQWAIFVAALAAAALSLALYDTFRMHGDRTSPPAIRADE